MQTFEITSWDGTRLAGYRGGLAEGRPMVLVNGLGGNITSWRPLVQAFSSHYRMLSYDYRGLYKSGPAPDWDAYTVAHHAKDLEHVLEVLDVQNPILVGWSMGVQVILELHRTRPDIASAFIALNGTPGEPFKTAFNTDLLHKRFETIFSVCRAHWQQAVRLRPVVARQPFIDFFARTLQVTGIASRTLDREIFAELALEWIEMDLGIYAKIFEQLGHHCAVDVLPSVQAPTLVVTGDRDRFTPAHRSVLMSNEIPDAELYVIPKATHFAPVEYPDQVNRRIWRFLSERGLIDASTGDPTQREVA